MAKLKRVMTSGGHFYGVRFHCPGCDRAHILPTDETPPEVTKADRWQFNRDYDRPVLSPSILSRTHSWEPPWTPEIADKIESGEIVQTKVLHVCHSYVGINGAQPGEIIFLGDCTHSFAGKVVPLPDIETQEDL